MPLCGSDGGGDGGGRFGWCKYNVYINRATTTTTTRNHDNILQKPKDYVCAVCYVRMCVCHTFY